MLGVHGIVRATGAAACSSPSHAAMAHRPAAVPADAGLGYPLFDLTASGLNMANRQWRPADANRHRVAAMTAGDNFGLIAIDWDRSPPQVSLQVRDATVGPLFGTAPVSGWAISTVS